MHQMNTSLIFLLLSCNSHLLIILVILNTDPIQSLNIWYWILIRDVSHQHHKGSLNHDCVSSVSIMIMLAVSTGNIKYVLWGYSFLSADSACSLVNVAMNIFVKKFFYPVLGRFNIRYFKNLYKTI